MKKFCAVIAAAPFDTAYFILGWLLLLNGYGNLFIIYIGPALTGVTFLLLGNLFHKHLQLSRVPLWFSMNLLGEFLGWIGLVLLSPEMLANPGGILTVLIFRLWGFAIVWIAIGIICAVLYLFRSWGEKRDSRIIEQTLAEDRDLISSRKSRKPARQSSAEVWKDRLHTAGICLCGLSVLMIGFSFYYTMKELPAEAYEDKGIYTFVAKNTYPTQVKTTGSRSSHYRTTTRTVYMVEYKAKEYSGYRWREEAPSQTTGKEWVKEGKTVQRRVLSIKDTNTYISVDPKYTAETYVSHNKSRYTMFLLIPGLYLIGYTAVWLHNREKRRLEEE